MNKGFSFISVLVLIFFVGAGVGIGFFWGQQSVEPVYLAGATNLEEGKPEQADFSLFWEAWHAVEQKYVDGKNLKYQDMLYGAISGMVESLGDPHTVFMTSEQAEEFLSEVEGSFEGVGMEVGLRDNEIRVIAPLEGTPADRAGVRAGDVILQINGTSTAGMSLEEAINLIRGPKGTTVTLTLHREGWREPREIAIERGVIGIPSLRWNLVNEQGKEDPSGTIAYIKLYQFSEKARIDFQRAVSEITASKADRIVLDLRNNPGGLLHISIDIAGWFVEDGATVVVEDFEGDREDETYKADGNPVFLSYPVVVLINEGSASASEILAGALRDLRQVELVGMPSFGKGSVQELERLGDGSYLKITIAHWLTPNGTLIEEKGLEPDVRVEMTDEDFDQGRDPQLQRALEVVGDM